MTPECCSSSGFFLCQIKCVVSYTDCDAPWHSFVILGYIIKLTWLLIQKLHNENTSDSNIPATSVSNWAPNMSMGLPLSRDGLCLSSQSLKEKGDITFMVFIWNGGSLKVSSVHPNVIMKNRQRLDFRSSTRNETLTWIWFSCFALLWCHEPANQVNRQQQTALRETTRSDGECERAHENEDVLLFDYRYQLGAEILAVEPFLKQDSSAVVHVVPESTTRVKVLSHRLLYQRCLTREYYSRLCG